MLKFFRKHQKFFFFIVTFFIVISFSFFGSFRSYLPAQKEEVDSVAGRCIDGSSFTLKELTAVSRLLTQETIKSGMPNLLHDDFLEKSILRPQLAERLAAAFFPFLSRDLEERLERVKSYQPYVHPEVPFICADKVWESLAPKVNEHLQELKAQLKAQPKTLSLLASLFLEQKKIPPDLVKRMLLLQQKQYSWISPDPTLERRDLSLFGFDSVKDWFGEAFIDLISQTILSGAARAKREGITLSLEEARGDLLHNAITGAEKTYGQKISLEDASRYLFEEAKLLGFEETSMVAAWQKVLLFSRLLDMSGKTLLHDPLFYDGFAAFANESAKVDLYELPQELRLGAFDDLLRFQFYLEKTAPEHALRADLPEELLSVEEVEKRCPELISSALRLEWREVDLATLSLDIPLKETLNWEGETAHWTLLKKEFPVLEKEEGGTMDSRLAFLDALFEKKRKAIDQFAREQMVKNDSPRLAAAFEQAPLHHEWVSFRMKGTHPLPFKGVKDLQAFWKALQSSEQLENFSEDGVHYLTVRVLERAQNKKLLTFAEVKSDPLFSELLERKLEMSCKEMALRDASFRTKEGGVKPLSEVKERVGALLLAPLFRALERALGCEGKQPSLDFYAWNRFVPFVQRVKAELEQNETSFWISSEKTGARVPWLIQKREALLTRKDPQGFDVEELFALAPPAWSSVQGSSTGAASFFHLLSRESGGVEGSEALREKGKALLADDAKRLRFEAFLQELQEKGGIVEIKRENG